MAVESRIDADENWFVGEDKTLRFTFIEGDTDGIDTWPMALELHGRRAKAGDPPAWATSDVSGIPATDDAPAQALVTVNGDATQALGPGTVQFVLRRTDSGARAVLSYGSGTLRSAVSA